MVRQAHHERLLYNLVIYAANPPPRLDSRLRGNDRERGMTKKEGVRSERGRSPLLNLFPLSVDGEGDTGGEVILII